MFLYSVKNRPRSDTELARDLAECLASTKSVIIG
jgi:hypothetical protein